MLYVVERTRLTPQTSLTRNRTGAVGALPSANDVLKNVQYVLSLEMHRQRGELGAVLFGTNEIFPLLQSLKKELTDERGRL